MRRISVEERRARLGLRHRLAPEALGKSVVDVARDLVVLHSTDPATVFLAVAARHAGPDVLDIERSLYEDRHLVRMLAMRRTMWVVPTETVPVVRAACTKGIAERERRRLIKMLEDNALAPAGQGESWLVTAEEATLEALSARGAAFGVELSAEVPALRTSFTYAEGKSYGGTQTVTTQVLNGLSMHGHIVRGRPRGKWNSSQYRWSPMAAWLPDGVVEVGRDDAQAQLIRSWLRAFGPATVNDVKWWTGLTLGEVKRALTRIEPVEVDLDGVDGIVLADDLGPVDSPDPWVALLPALDPTAMGWTERDWYLGEHRPLLFDRSGNIGPTVWCDGRIVGGWAQRKGGADDGTVVFRLFEDIGSDMTAAVAALAERLTGWIGDVRVIPRFRTPVDRELTS